LVSFAIGILCIENSLKGDGKMKKRRFLSIVLAVTAITLLLLALMPVGMALATNPLQCVIDYSYIGDFDDQGRFISWEAAVSGCLDGTARWWGDPTAMRFTGQASHYEDNWELVDSAGNVLLAGEESGSTTVRHMNNSNWRTNGTVTEANGAFANWLGRQTHASGHFTWTPDGLPFEGSGILCIN
jgi:hypothetical protein